MIRHIVMFKLKEELSERDLTDIISRAKTDLEALVPKIDVLRDLKVYTNVNPKEEYHFSLIADLDKFEDVEVYALHPDHMAIVTGLIKPNLAKRACVDIVV